jgi:hypothetical protein
MMIKTRTERGEGIKRICSKYEGYRKFIYRFRL